MSKNLSAYSWWTYLDDTQRGLLAQSFELLEREKREGRGSKGRKGRKGEDYSFVVFSAAKAYEGFLKKLFYDTGLITKDDFEGKQFRIGRALNPSLGRNHWAGSVYERLKSFCGGEALPYGLWQTWKESRNLLFHYFKDEENRISLKEAEKRLLMVQKAIGSAFVECRPEKEKQTLRIKKRLFLRRIFWFYSLLLIIWGFYRYLLRLPETVEELVLKPLIWLGPMVFIIKFKEKRPVFPSLGFINKNIFRSFYLGILGGIAFALTGLLLNLLKYGRLNFVPLETSAFFLSFALSLATAFCEETVFRGYLLNRFFEIWRQEWKALFISSLAFVIIHLPITMFALHYNLAQIYIYGVLVFFYSLGSGILFLRTGTIWAPILMHVFWSWPIILFR